MSKKPATDAAVIEEPAAEAQTTALVNWEDQLAKYAVDAASAEDLPAGTFLSFKAGVLTINGNKVGGNALDCIVIANIHENALYVGKYDSQNPQSPECFAFAETEDNLAPHPSVKNPRAENCAECPNNAWGSDPDGGRGKACKMSE